MRAVRLILPFLLLGAAATPVLAAAGGDPKSAAAPGTIAIEEGNGVVQIKGRGIVIGRVQEGSVLIVDGSPTDPWSPRVNGVPRGRSYGYRGTEINFIIPGGRFKLLIRGEGISISARGDGVVQIDADTPLPGTLPLATIQVGDGQPREIPDHPVRVSYGGDEQDTSFQSASRFLAPS